MTPPGSGALSNSFDASGNQTGRGSDTFACDAQSGLTAATVGGTGYTMSNDGEGLQQTRTTGGTTMTFTWDRNRKLPVILDDGTQYAYDAGVGPLEHVTRQRHERLPARRAGPDHGAGQQQRQRGQKTYSYDPYGAVTGSAIGPLGQHRNGDAG